MKLIYVPDVFRRIVDRVNENLPFDVHYDFGHYRVVEQNIILQQTGVSVRNSYPLVWLVMDFEERMGVHPLSYAEVPGVQFIVAMNTQVDYTMQQRRDNVFLPYLYPIVSELIRQFTLSKELGFPSIHRLGFTKIDRPYWGLQESGDSKTNMFRDYIDAVQLKNFNFKIRHVDDC